MTSTILISTMAFITESMPAFQFIKDECNVARLSVDDCQPLPVHFFYQLEVVCIIIFTLDYLARIGLVHSSDLDDCGFQEKDFYGARFPLLYHTWKYATSAMNLVDFCAIVPFYGAELSGGGGGIPVLRVLRLIRVFRLLKAPKLRNCADMFANVLIDAAPALFTLLFVTTLMCVLFASCMHFAEGSTYSVDADFLGDNEFGVYVRPSGDGYTI